MYEIDKKTKAPKLNKDGSFKAKTSHTLNPVPFIVYDNFTGGEYKVKLGREDFGLSSVAATTVNLLGFEAPEIWDESMVEL
jgi:2,3-bisphosphoglycerate-independent phosphoglycerate mutase